MFVFDFGFRLLLAKNGQIYGLKIIYLLLLLFLVIGALTLRRIRTQIEIKWLVKANICCCYSCCRSCGLAGNSKMKNNSWLLCINLFRWELQWVTNAPDKPTGLLDIVEWSSMWMKARRRLLLLLLPLLLILFNVFFFLLGGNIVFQWKEFLIKIVVFCQLLLIQQQQQCSKKQENNHRFIETKKRWKKIASLDKKYTKQTNEQSESVLF